MRAIILISVILALGLKVGHAEAADAKKHKHQHKDGVRRVSLIVFNGYSKQQTLITKDKDGWYCETELLPYTVIAGEPKSFAAVDPVMAKKYEAKDFTSCKEHISIADSKAGDRVTQACVDDPLVKAMLKVMAKECGRN